MLETSSMGQASPHELQLNNEVLPITFKLYDPKRIYSAAKEDLVRIKHSSITLAEHRIDDSLFDSLETSLETTEASVLMRTNLQISPEQRVTRDLGLYDAKRIGVVKSQFTDTGWRDVTPRSDQAEEDGRIVLEKDDIKIAVIYDLENICIQIADNEAQENFPPKGEFARKIDKYSQILEEVISVHYKERQVKVPSQTIILSESYLINEEHNAIPDGLRIYDPDARVVTQAGEREAKFFAELEKRILAAKTVWLYAKELNPPSINDTHEQVASEEAGFDAIKTKINAMYPETASLIRRSRELFALQKSNHGLKRDQKKEQEKLDRLLDTPDARLVLQIEVGIEALKDKRQMIRDVLRGIENAGGSVQSVIDYLESEEKSKIDPSNIRSLVTSNFSINILVDPETLKQYESDVGAIGGFHLSYAIFNIVDAEEAKHDSKIFGHEDFHSFSDGMLPFDYWQLDHNKYLQKLVGNLKRAEAKGQENKVQENIEKIKLGLLTVVDSDLDELLAEIASGSHDFFSGSTFEQRRKNKIENIQSILHSHPQVDRHAEMAIDRLYKFEYQINSLYRKVEAEAPERKTDLDVVFSLMPLSKMRHIEKLVDHWIAER